jgi:hypothetical protein
MTRRPAPESDGMTGRPEPATLDDLHAMASAMPGVTVTQGTAGNRIYQTGGKSFIFFRNPRPDAVDPDTGERYDDVVVFWVPSESDKQALIQDPHTPFFTTSHFDGHSSVLLRTSRLGELSRSELRAIVEDAWLSRASPAKSSAWLARHGPDAT